MALVDEFETYDYQHPDWDEKSVWTFRRHKTKPDEEAISALAWDYRTEKVTPRQLRELRRQGKSYDPEITTVQKMSPLIAELSHMSEGWDGAEFVAPKTMRIRKADGTLESHPLAGQLVPCTAEWIARVEPSQLDDCHAHMTAVWEGIEDEAEFRPAGENVAESAE